MIGFDLLNNKGMQFIGNENILKEKEKTIIVLGIARGGTSLVAGTLDHLGVFGGDKSKQPVFEDVRLADAFENNTENFNDIIEEYNSKHDIWYFKRPKAIDYSEKLDKIFSNPLYLIIFKDIFSVSNRNSISMQSDVVHGLKKAYEDYGKLVSFISSNNLNAFLLSYEKIMQNKEDFVDILVSVIGEDSVTTEQKESALKFIEPNPSEYLNASRITRGVGRIGLVGKTKIIGWGKRMYSDEPVIVELYINNVFFQETLANEYRQNVFEEGKHPTGHCGYSFDLTENPLNDGDIVSAKIKDDVVFLNGSNFKFVEKQQEQQGQSFTIN